MFYILIALGNIHHAASHTNLSLNEFSGKNFSDLKSQLAEVLSSKISPISDEIKKLINDQNYLDKVLAEGANKAEEIAGKKIKEMKKIIGF